MASDQERAAPPADRAELAEKAKRLLDQCNTDVPEDRWPKWAPVVAVKAAIDALARSTDAPSESVAKKADWELRLEGAAAFAEEYGGHEGCACRWDEKDNRVATCARHQGWLDVIGEWSERAKSAEAALTAYTSAESPAKSPSISERLAWAQRTKSIADDALNAYQRWGHPRAGETDYQEAIDLRTRLLAGIEGLSTLSLQAAPSDEAFAIAEVVERDGELLAVFTIGDPDMCLRPGDKLYASIYDCPACKGAGHVPVDHYVGEEQFWTDERCLTCNGCGLLRAGDSATPVAQSKPAPATSTPCASGESGLLQMVVDDMDTCCGEFGAAYQFKELSAETVEAIATFRARMRRQGIPLSTPATSAERARLAQEAKDMAEAFGSESAYRNIANIVDALAATQAPAAGERTFCGGSTALDPTRSEDWKNGWWCGHAEGSSDAHQAPTAGNTEDARSMGAVSERKEPGSR